MAEESQSHHISIDHDDGGHDKRGPAPEESNCHNISIDVNQVEEEGLDPSWVSKFNEKGSIEPQKLRVSSANSSCSIHRVPQNLRQLNENAYSPTAISIGPFHYDKRKGPLRAMEEHKRRYLNNILSRSGEGTLERCLIAVKALEETARECYSEVFAELDSFSFVEMLVLDGCFIIEFFRKFLPGVENDDLDPIFQLGWLWNAILVDLIMLENQIPFVILLRLFDLIDKKNHASSPSSSFIEGVLRGYGELNWKAIEDTIKDSNAQIQHLLHLFHTSSFIFMEYKPSGSWNMLDLIPTASRLQEGGIEFRKRDEDHGGVLDIKFHKRAIQIPPIYITGLTKIVLPNCIAFEQCYNYCLHYFTAWAFFMDCLINTDKDVEILGQNGILRNKLGNDEDLTAFFNNMGTELFVLKDFYLGGYCDQINQYYIRPWPKLRATLVRDYFKNPWAIISFFAALLLLLLTMIQAFFSSFPKFANGS